MTVIKAPAPTRHYSVVNDAINNVIFDGRFKLVPVYLDIEGHLAEEIGAQLGVTPDECLDVVAAAVASTLTWHSGNPFSKHIADLQAWNELERFGPPPFTALLAALSLAAERMRGDDTYSAHNYYERLFEVLGVRDETRKNSIRSNAKSKRQFWDALNLWLAENDFEFGRPTARKVNDWEYASFALSQALVRDGDRKRLHALFVEYGLAPHEHLTDAEMKLYLHEWMRGGAASTWLKRIWSVPDLRDRVAGAACAELEAWDGQGAQAEGREQRRRLSWAASLQTFPAQRLRMFMSAAAGEDETQIDLVTPPELAPAAAAAFADCGSGLWLTPSAVGEISILEPVANIQLSPLMLASFDLMPANKGPGYSRVARSIIPMVKLDTGAFYREVSRISFLRPHLVLCHERWGDRVGKLLELNARQGFKKWASRDLQGLPEDWLLFSGVEMLRLPAASTGDANLQALVPLAEGVSLEMTGGLRLSQNLWHASAPPEITAAVTSGLVSLALADAEGSVIGRSSTTGASCRLTLNPDQIPQAADLTLSAIVGEKVRSETNLSFRSANEPRRLGGPEAFKAFAFSPERAGGFVSAAAVAAGPADLAVRGMVLRGGRMPAASISSLPLLNGITPSQAEEETPRELEGEYGLRAIEGLSETCVLRGSHYWVCEDFNKGDDPRDDKWMTCTDCRIRVLTRNRGVAVKKRARQFASKAVASAAAGPRMYPRKLSAVDPDLILDAVGYLGAGTWRKLLDLSSSDGEPPLAAQRLAASLSALGHIDVTYDSRLCAAQSWMTAPPSLVCTPSGTAFFAGFRNEELLAGLQAHLERAGGVLSVTPQDDAPTAFIWTGIGPEQAQSGLENLRDRHGRRVTITHGFTTAIAANAPPVSAIEALMPPIRLDGAKELQRFDLDRGAWRPADTIEPCGAYRGEFAGRRYLYCSADGVQREGSFSLVKLLAARSAGRALHSYDPGRRVFQAVLGCEPPGLFHRSLVAASGLMPVKRGPLLAYGGVAPDDAAAIINKLYS